MADRVVLHIGPRKTGTSYLQNTLWANRDRLAAQGFWLPLEAMAEHYEAVSGGREGWWSSGRADELRATLAEQVRTRPGVAVISTELISSLRFDETAALVADLGDTPVDVVFGVRALSRSIPAEWQQWVRARSTMSYDVWLAALRDDPQHGFWKTQHPERIVHRWSRLVPRERIQAVIVPASAYDPGELWNRFSAAIGLDSSGFELPGDVVNASLGLVQAELLRRVNEAVDPAFTNLDYRRRIRRSLTRGVLPRAEGARQVVLPPDQIGWVEERSGQIADALADSGVILHGDPADLHVVPPKPDADPMTVTDAELVDAAVDALLGLTDLLAERNAAIWNLRRQAEGTTRQPRGPS